MEILMMMHHPPLKIQRKKNAKAWIWNNGNQTHVSTASSTSKGDSQFWLHTKNYDAEHWSFASVARDSKIKNLVYQFKSVKFN
jgi:hypothetical protein